jgi:cytoskeletal protein CcmA (bactofilin family)
VRRESVATGLAVTGQATRYKGVVMKRIVLVAVVLAFLPAAAASQQTELGGKVRSGREVTVPAGETVQGDLVASAGTVRIDGRVDGDLVASGGQVTVAGTVTGDLLAAAGSTTISGEVGGDARIATGQARLQGQVGEDLLVAAGQATVDRGARIGGDLIFGTGRIQMDGAVAGSVLGSTGNYARGGSVGGSERVNVQQPPGQRQPTLADRVVDAVRRYVSILVIGVLLLWLLPRVLRGAADAARRRPLVSFGVGILGFIGVIVALVLLLFVTVLVAVVLGLLGLGSLTGVTVFGGLLAAAAIVFLFVLAVAFAAQATVGLALGRLLVRGDGRSFLGSLGALAVGVLVVVLVAAIPVAGGFLEALLVLLGLGALMLMARRAARQQVAQPVGSAPPSSL